MKVAYYESRQNSKQVSYIKHFNPMHGWWSYYMHEHEGFSAKLVNPGIMLNSQNWKKTSTGRNWLGP